MLVGSSLVISIIILPKPLIMFKELRQNSKNVIFSIKNILTNYHFFFSVANIVS
jgi:hypothetical protein